jgi:membrane protein
MSDPVGRDATTPREIPRQGWKDIARRVKEEARDDNVTLMAGGVAFFAVLSLVPALAALVSIYGLAVSPDTVVRHVDELSGAVPDEARRLLTDQLDRVARSSDTGLGLGVLVGLVLALWSASAAVKHLITAVSAAYDEHDHRSPVRVRALAVGLTLGGIVFMSLALFVLTGLPGAAESVGGDIGRTTATVVRWPALALLMLAALAVVYRVAPDRDDPRWRWVSWGAVAATALWLLASAGFSVYASRFGSYNETYGTMGAIVVLMLWLYLTALVVVLGAELNAEMEHQTARDTTVGPAAPLGRRRAEMADTIGASR